ncbi:hypothetical protein HY02_01285 [Peptococcaceae bacterium SCADC1_2_3]|nr:hypothetical protein DK28_0213015 [Peptococcaceae bacterium SCADC1_2_3]KFI37925.1 hypothetical protein HY02_01285 [Peptococcaceae bacterium SCADC1_2_3]
MTCLGGLSADNVYAGTADGLHHFDVSGWTQVVTGKAATRIGKTADGKVLVCYGREVTCLDGGQWTSLGQAPYAPSKIEGTALDDLYAVMNGKLYLRKNDGNWYVIKKSDGSLLATTVCDFNVLARRDFLVTGLGAPYGGNYFNTPILYHGSVIPVPPPVNNDQEVTAYLRVEGYDRTILPRTRITLARFGLGSAGGPYLNQASGGSANPWSEGWGVERFEGPTALHILLRVLIDSGFTKHNPANPVDGTMEFDVQDYGWSLYVAMVGGQREFDQGGTSGWLYRVNGWLPNYGSQSYYLEDGDEVVWYYSATGFDTWYINFKADREEVGPGETVHFTLTGETTDLSGAGGTVGDTVVQPIANASLLVNGQPYPTAENPLKTDAEGKAAITFDTTGAYEVNCEGWNIFGTAGAVRPASINITVSASPGDITPPVFASGYPKAEDITAAGFNLKLKLNEAGTAYYKVVAEGVAPGDDYENWTTVTIAGTDKVSAPVSGLAYGTDYDVYVIAKDAAGNLQATPVKLDVTTLAEDAVISRVREAIARVTNYVKSNQTYSSDWLIVGLRNAGEEIPANYLDDTAVAVKNYFATTVNTKSENVTYHERRVLGIVAAGGNPRNTGGHSLLERIYNFYIPANEATGLQTPRDITFQGLNGVIYGLIALDTMRYPIPEGARYSRDYLFQYLLSKQNNDGGWNLSASGNSDVDITAMTLIGLAPYHDREDVMNAINKGVAWLSQKQSNEGGYYSWGSYNSEAVSQTIIALCANGIDPTSEPFTKNGKNLLDALLSFLQENGSILHTLDGTGVMGMATEQGYQALLAYDKFVKKNGEYNGGKTSIYYFEDETAPEITVNGISDGATVTKAGLSFSIAVSDNKDDTVTPIVKLNGTVLAAGDSGNYSCTLAEGNNTITVEAADAAGNKAQKNVTVHIIATTPQPDVNNDDQVNIMDMILIGQKWGQTGNPGWISEDVNQDGKIDVLDMIMVGQHWTG